MTRVFLVNPPSPEPVRTPLLSFCHLGASLRAGGHQVALLDASAPFAPSAFAAIEDRIAEFAPDVVGLHIKTLHAQPAYALAAWLARRWPLIAGGPHPTVCPDEPFAHGFRYVVRGEGEEALVELCDALDGKRAWGSVAGLSFFDRGILRHNMTRPFLTDLDRLAPPLDALDLFDPAWYGASSTGFAGAEVSGGAPPPAGILSSRGCPAACTFCSNNVTGRRFRYRSPESVTAEVTRLGQRHGLHCFSFFDDSFAVGRRRVRELCSALQNLPTPIYWTCTAHPAHLDPDILREMKRAGCAGIDIGMESADPEMLVRIGKGVTVERVLDVLAWCRQEGIHSVVNLMFGWPDETDAELDATIAFLDRAKDLAGGFNARGVVVPYPGTQIYDDNHQRFGFTDWWIRETPLLYPPFPTSWSEVEIARAYATDPALDRNFFAHPSSRIERIRQALVRKAELTLAIQLRRVREATAAVGVPAAGAR